MDACPYAEPSYCMPRHAVTAVGVVVVPETCWVSGLLAGLQSNPTCSRASALLQTLVGVLSQTQQRQQT